MCCCFFRICSLFFCYVVCWRWQFYRVVEFLGKSYFHVKINPFKQLWCFNRIAFGNLLHVSSWRVCVRFTLLRSVNPNLKCQQIKSTFWDSLWPNTTTESNEGKKKDFFVPSVERTKKNKHRVLHVKFRKTFLIHTHMPLFGIRFELVNATSLFSGFCSVCGQISAIHMLKHSVFRIARGMRQKKTTKTTATTTGHSADCRRNRCINRHKIIQFLRMAFDRLVIFVCCLQLFQSTLIHRNQRQKWQKNVHIYLIEKCHLRAREFWTQNQKKNETIFLINYSVLNPKTFFLS